MSFLKRLFGGFFQPSTLRVHCDGCETTYNIGEDAFVITTKISMKSLVSSGASVVFSGDGAKENDLVALCETIPTERRALKVQESKEALRGIREYLSKGLERSWTCSTCNQVNNYPESFGADSSPAIDNSKPSVGYYRDLATSLMKKHGNLVRIEDRSTLTASSSLSCLGYP